ATRSARSNTGGRTTTRSARTAVSRTAPPPPSPPNGARPHSPRVSQAECSNFGEKVTSLQKISLWLSLVRLVVVANRVGSDLLGGGNPLRLPVDHFTKFHVSRLAKALKFYIIILHCLANELYLELLGREQQKAGRKPGAVAI